MPVSTSAPSLLSDWDLLQSDVIPALIEGGDDSSAAWSIGSIDDAVALGVAFQHAQPSRRCDALDLYSSGANPGVRESGFALAELKYVPDVSRSSCMVRHDRRWVADERLAEHVFLSDPDDYVDLVTVRPAMAEADTDLRRAVEQLRLGGQLLLVAPDSAPSVPAGLEEVRSNGSGRVYRKCSPTKGRGRMATRCKVAERVDTLARRRAQDELVDKHLRLACSLARRFAHHGEPAEDLEQVAMMALLKAAKRFDPDRNIRFATYATSSILGELKRHFRDKTWMLRVPRPVQELYLMVKETRYELTHELGQVPTTQQIAARLAVSEAAVLDAMRAGDNFWPASLDGRSGEDSPTELPVIDESFDQCLDRLHVQRSLPSLDKREQTVLKRVYFDGSTQREVAAELGISQMQVSRLVAQAVAKLRA